MDLLLQVRPLVCVLDHLAVGVQFDDDGGRTDVFALLDGLVGRQERFVLYKLEAARMVDQGITCNACFRVVGFGEAAVDDKQFPVCLDRVLAFDGAYGDMSVDDVAVLAGDAELVQQHVTDRFFFSEGIVGAFSSFCTDLSSMKQRSKVAIRLLSKRGESLPSQRYQM